MTSSDGGAAGQSAADGCTARAERDLGKQSQQTSVVTSP